MGMVANGGNFSSHGRPPEYSLTQLIMEAVNDIHRLIPVGTLNFYDLPLAYSSLSGTAVSDDSDGWKWLDLPFLLDTIPLNTNPIIKDLRFLIAFHYFRATYKTIKVNFGNEIYTMARVRLYAIPLDIQGSKEILEWRNTRRKKNQNEQVYRNILINIISLMDYSPKNWEFGQSQYHELISFVNSGIPLIPFHSVNSNLTVNSRNAFNFHLQRWKSNRPYEKPLDTEDKSSVTVRLQRLYDSVDSPDLSVYHKILKKDRTGGIPSSEETLVSLVEGVESHIHIQGVKADIYPFQVNSIAKMFEKETSSKKAVMPNFVQLHSPDKTKCFYFNTLNYGFYVTPEVFSLPRGGILAENMGLGKTLICLSLICLTKYDVSAIPNDRLLYDETDRDITVVFSDLASKVEDKSKRLRKLSELCVETINQNSLPWKFYSDSIPSSVIHMLGKSPGYFRIPLENDEYLSPFNQKTRTPSMRWRAMDKNTTAEGTIYRTLYLCNTTLIIVPDNILHQWNNELKKHIEPTFLKKLFISSNFKKLIITEQETFTDTIPSDPKELILYDLIIISTSLMIRQLADLKNSDNPLNHVYWKRLIIDEGHSMNSKGTRASELCKVLLSERRWAVTGTPTAGLTRLHVDEEQSDELRGEVPSPKKKNKYTIKTKLNEKDDLTKLGTIVGNFLQVEPFYSQKKLWSITIVKPFSLNIYGASISLGNLLNYIMVRHSLSDIDHDIKLPQLHHEAVFLQPSFHNKISINLFTAVLAVNAVTSERTDVDYMFHPANRQQLRRLVTNLQRATFHWTGFQQEDVEALIHVCNHSLKKRKANGQSVYTHEDLSLINKSLDISKLALSNTRWRTAALLHEMHYYLSGLPDIFTKSFGTGVLESTDSTGKHNDISVFGAPHIHAMQEFFYKNRFMDMKDEARLKEKLDEKSKPFWNSYWKDNLKKNSEKFDKGTSNSKIKAHQVTEALRLPEIVEDYDPSFRKRRLSDTDAKTTLTRDNGQGLKFTDGIQSKVSSQDNTISYEILKQASILGTASTKLSYLASRLLEHQENGIKSIVFFEFEDSAYYLTELLDLLGVNYILYATFIKQSQRANNLAEFSSYASEIDGGISLIMDLRLASHGLTIISATHVYFVSPVWQRSVEAQAIKRAHRIGQTKDVYVETLVLEGTLEEEIYKRRSKDTEVGEEDGDGSDATQRKRYVIDDTGMQDFILKHEFIDFEINEKEYTPFVAPTSLNQVFRKDDDVLGYSLLKHTDSTYRNNAGHIMREWTARVFSKDNLTKLNNLKTKKLLEAERTDIPFREFEPHQLDDYKTLVRGPKRKKVRF